MWVDYLFFACTIFIGKRTNKCGLNMSKNILIKRRGFLVGGASVAIIAGLGLAATKFAGDESEYGALLNGEVPEVLSVREMAVLTLFASRIIPDRASAPTTAEARVARRIDKELSFAGDKLASDMKASLLYLEFSPVLHMSLTKFSRMTEAAQDDFIAKLQHSSDAMERSIYNGLRFMCMFFYYTDERVWPSIGYEAPLMERKFFAAGNSLENLPPRNVRSKI